jgi:hypothetical protein
MPQHLTLAPIVVGYQFAFTLGFTGADGAPPPGLDLSTASRVLGQFRKSREDDGAPLAAVDTQNGSLTIVNAHTISFVLSKESTAVMNAGQPAWVDFARLDNGVWSHIPVLIGWPVIDPVTIPPA